ncbi:MAG: PfkB family carbohydrate kinase [Pseudomonadota bacterium]|nr:PfkB family carbohydrate kinase [Pseudomonadota bacterium]
MLHSPDIVHTVAAALDRYQLANVVLQALFPRAAIITPNLDEAALLLGQPITDALHMPAATQALLDMGARAVLLKGGHLPGDEVHDVLWQADQPPQTMRTPRMTTRNLHGAGCTLSSAIEAHLACGLPLAEAVDQARHYVRDALLAGATVRTGEGVGPLNHGFAPLPMQRRPLP